MRPTTQLLSSLLALTASACMADIGGDECVGARCHADPSGAGSGSGAGSAADCVTPTELKTDLRITSDADFAGLPKGCWSLNATLLVQGPAITSLAKLGDLIEVNNLKLVDTGLASIDAAQRIKVYGNLMVSGNAALTSLRGLDVVRWSGGTSGGAWSVSYTIRNNPLLAELDTLKYIETVDGDLQITDSPKLGAIELDELTKVGGAVVISNTGASAIRLTALTQVGRVELAMNPALTELRGLGASSIAGDVILRGNPRLAQLGAMSSVTTIGGALVVDGNAALTDLSGLTGALRTVYGSVTISNNALLTGLGQLGHLSAIGATSITSNPKLGYCKALEIAHCVPNSSVTISGNLNQSNCQCWCGR
jgi:hypothetical protein